MPLYHCSIKTVSRSSGKSATGAAAYRAGACLKDERTGQVHDYRRKQGILHTELVLPAGVALSRSELWNQAEHAENRKNSTVGREYELALPSELDSAQRQALAVEFGRHLADRYGVCADVCIHAPGRRGDQRNHHAHILTTTRQVTAAGFGAKTRALDDRKSGEVEHIRATWATLCNRALEDAGHAVRVDHRSYAAQGLDIIPTTHLGPSASAIQRRGGQSDRADENEQIRLANEEIAAIKKEFPSETAKPMPEPKSFPSEPMETPRPTPQPQPVPSEPDEADKKREEERRIAQEAEEGRLRRKAEAERLKDTNARLMPTVRPAGRPSAGPAPKP